jgi:uncharacterized protein YjiK
MQKKLYCLTAFLISFFALCLFSHCRTTTSYKSPAGYNFTNPEKFELPAALNEISGITFFNESPDTILAIEDEDGRLYNYCLSNKKLSYCRFAKKGDYEDVAVLNNNKVAVLKSDGTVCIFPLPERGKERTDSTMQYNAVLPPGEYEGLFADGDTLFALCKNCRADKASAEVTVYAAVQDAKGTINTASSFAIDVSKIQAHSKEGKIKFHPSALAKNPVTHDWYIISSVNKLLLVLDKYRNVKEVYPIDPALFKQPEGIAFNQNGDLCISNEGGGGAANILLFRYNPAADESKRKQAEDRK